MKLFLTTILPMIAIVTVAAPIADSVSVIEAAEPPPLWDPPAALPPPLFSAPEEDLPLAPSWLVSVQEAPIQLVRVERLAPFTAATVQPLDNIYAPSSADEEGKFEGQGSLRPAHKSFGRCVVAFLRGWIWWISIVILAAVLVHIAERMLIGGVKAARKARSASRVARSRAASIIRGTRSRAASLLGDAGLGGSVGQENEKAIRFEDVRSFHIRSHSWGESMA